MPETLQGLVVIILALLPGALYTWAFEQQAGPWGIGLSDRVLRFIGSSALFHAVLAPASYELWRRFIESERIPRWGGSPCGDLCSADRLHDDPFRRRPDHRSR
jgi:hypothetical protein